MVESEKRDLYDNIQRLTHYASKPPEPQIAGPRTRCLGTTRSCWRDPPIEGDPDEWAWSWIASQHRMRGLELMVVGEVWSIQPTRRSLTISCNNGLSKVNWLWIVCTPLWTTFKATKLSIERFQPSKLEQLEYYVTLTGYEPNEARIA